MLFDENLLAGALLHQISVLVVTAEGCGKYCKTFLGRIFNSIGHLKTKTIAKERQ